MTKKLLLGILFCSFFAIFSYSQTNAPQPFGPVPNENQLRWQKMEFYAFIHFSLNTYTDENGNTRFSY